MPNRITIRNLPGDQVNDQPIVTILDELTPEELSRIAVDVVREHRRRLERAQSLFDEIEASRLSCGTEENARALRHAYRMAMLELKLHHELVRIVIDALGYVPDVPPESEIH